MVKTKQKPWDSRVFLKRTKGCPWVKGEPGSLHKKRSCSLKGEGKILAKSGLQLPPDKEQNFWLQFVPGSGKSLFEWNSNGWQLSKLRSNGRKVHCALKHSLLCNSCFFIRVGFEWLNGNKNRSGAMSWNFREVNIPNEIPFFWSLLRNN